MVLVHDHRNFGPSDGAIRHDIDPWCQIADWRRATDSWNLNCVHPGRMGIWGTSYAGGPFWFSAPRIDLSARSSRKRRRSAATSKACGVWCLMLQKHWKGSSMRMSARNFAANRRAPTNRRRRFPRYRRLIAPKTRSLSISKPYHKVFGKMRSPCVQVASPECMTPEIGSHACRPHLCPDRRLGGSNYPNRSGRAEFETGTSDSFPVLTADFASHNS